MTHNLEIAATCRELTIPDPVPGSADKAAISRDLNRIGGGRGLSGERQARKALAAPVVKWAGAGRGENWQPARRSPRRGTGVGALCGGGGEDKVRRSTRGNGDRRESGECNHLSQGDRGQAIKIGLDGTESPLKGLGSDCRGRVMHLSQHKMQSRACQGYFVETSTKPTGKVCASSPKGQH